MGKPRCTVVLPKLKELNPLCAVHAAASLEDSMLVAHSAVVITQPLDLSLLVSINEKCRANRVSFFYAFTGGVATDIFVDHGPDHMVHDFDGERPMQKLITNISKLNADECLVRYETPEGQLPVSITKGFFEISEIEGIAGLNEQLFQVKTGDRDPVKSIRIPFSLPAGEEYAAGGILTEKKVPTKYPMKSLQSKLTQPGNAFAVPPTLVLTDLLNFGSETQQHIAHYATLSFLSTHSALPRANNPNDALEVVGLAKKLLDEKAVDLDDFELDEALVKRCDCSHRRYA